MKQATEGPPLPQPSPEPHGPGGASEASDTQAAEAILTLLQYSTELRDPHGLCQTWRDSSQTSVDRRL